MTPFVVFMPNLEAEAALVQSGGPFFDIDHFRGRTGVLVQLSRLDEIGVDELEEVITEAWAHRAPARDVRAHLGEPPDPFAGLSSPARQALTAAGIFTDEQAAAVSDADLLALPGFGPTGLRTLPGNLRG